LSFSSYASKRTLVLDIDLQKTQDVGKEDNNDGDDNKQV
jgi:hypothetical protein